MICFTTKHLRNLALALAMNLPCLSLAQSVDEEDWVPIVVLRSEAAVPLRPGNIEQEVLLGFARARDLEEGLPLDIGWYRVRDPATGLLDSSVSSNLTLAQSSRVRVNVSTEQASQLGCRGQLAPLDPTSCADSDDALRAVSLQTQYRLGTTLWSLGIGQSRIQADPQYWLSDVTWISASLMGRTYVQDSVNLGGQVQTSYGTFDLGLQLARSELAPLFGEQLNQGRFSISWLHGNLGGALNTRVHRLEGGHSDFWGGIDLGLIWRTPWNGLLSIGARNLVTSGRPPTSLDPEAAALDASESRIPYVRYEQDL